jgi:hypothetical protein
MEEMMEETLEMDEDEEVEEEADAEVDKVLFELTDGKLGVVGSVANELPVSYQRIIYPVLPNGRVFIDFGCRRRRDRKNHGTVPTAA